VRGGPGAPLIPSCNGFPWIHRGFIVSCFIESLMLGTKKGTSVTRPYQNFSRHICQKHEETIAV
jgi:hypothetical protein